MDMLYNPFTTAIEEFRGPYRFLSNFYLLDDGSFSQGIHYEGIWYVSVEHAYQASKTSDPDQRQRFSDTCIHCGRGRLRHGNNFSLPFENNDKCPGDVSTRFRMFSSGEAKRAGRRLKLRPDWERVKLDIMLDLLRLKFARPLLGAKLIATGDAELVEGNDWGDRYWGRCYGDGENHLGKLLMQVRKELQSK